jgi:hypothetical protein
MTLALALIDNKSLEICYRSGLGSVAGFTPAAANFSRMIPTTHFAIIVKKSPGLISKAARFITGHHTKRQKSYANAFEVKLTVPSVRDADFSPICQLPDGQFWINIAPR